MSTVVKDLGAVSAYAYAVEKGYTGAEAEFAELMADYAEVGQRAEDAADSALESKTAAQTAATTATNKASEATTAAQTATNKAAEAQADADAAALDASQAMSAASTATSKAAEATTAAATATSAATTATTAKDDAVSAKTAAQTAQTGAETAAASVQSSAAQIATNTEDITQLKEGFTETTSNVLRYKSAVTVNGVQVKNNGSAGLSVIGTGTANGGRRTKITEDLTIPAGEYWFCVWGNGTIPPIYLQSAETILRAISNLNTCVKVSIESEKTVYLGFNVVAGAEYNATKIYIYLSTEEPFLTNHDSAVDFVARNYAEKIKYISLSSFQTVKGIFPFTVGSFLTSDGGSVNDSIRYRIVSAKKYVANAPLRVFMPNGYKFGVITYPSGSPVDSGWKYGEYIIPANMPFFIQLAKNPEVTSDKIANAEDSDLYRALEFSAYTQPLKRQILSLEKLNANDVWSQGACKVGATLFGFGASAEDHSTNGSIFRYDLSNDFAALPKMYHNLGHASVADYAKSTDTLMVGTGTYTSGSQESIYLVKHMESKNTGGYSISVSDPDVVELDVESFDGVSCGACFGETDQIMYLIKVESAMQYDTLIKKYIYKMLLGKGSNDLTASHPTDSIGTYVDGCAENEYNGTACVIERYTIDVYGEMQGLKYRNGYLIYATDTAHFDAQKTPYIAKIDPLNETVEYFKLPFYNSTTGAELAAESEGIVIDGADAYTAIVGSGQSGVFKFSSVF